MAIAGLITEGIGPGGSISGLLTGGFWPGPAQAGVGGHFLPLTKKQRLEVQKRAREEQQRREDKWAEKVSDEQDLVRALSKDTLESVEIKVNMPDQADPSDDDEDDLEAIIMAA